MYSTAIRLFSGKRLVEPYEGKVYVVQNPPAKPLTQEEMDDVYDLPYMRSYHPSYEAAGVFLRSVRSNSALSATEAALVAGFCALTFHQEGSSRREAMSL